jgi:DNA-binding transcriptional regulator LsrR (DeoR family)
MPRAKDRDSEFDELTAAYMAAQGEKQIAIAHTLDLSQAAVSRLLEKARHKYLHQELRFIDKDLSAETMERIRRRASRRPSNDALNRILQFGRARGPSLWVFPCEAPPDKPDERMEELSRHAARHIRDLIQRSKCFGVTWGGMVSSVARALRDLSLPAPWSERGNIDVIPLSGEPLGNDPTTYSSSSIAHVLGQVINGEKYYARSLAMVPAFVPEGFEPKEVAGVWRLIGLVKSHAEIFGPHGARAGAGDSEADRVDMILTSVGPAERPLGFGRGTLVGKTSIRDLPQLVVGDMGGVCFPKRALTPSQKASLETVAERWTGLSRRHIEQCARRAFGEKSASTGPPGVVVVSVGRKRAPFLLEAIRLGLINHLIVDDELQDGLEQAVKARYPEVASELRARPALPS